MVNHTSILIVSILIIIIPQLGFPNVWQKNITSVLAVLIIALTIRAMRSGGETPSGEGDTYVDTNPAHLASETTQPQHENNS